MKIFRSKLSVVFWVSSMAPLAGCNFDGGPVIITDTDHQVNVLTSTTDSNPLSVLVRKALRNNGQTALAQIKVSQDSEDTVKLSGNVNNDAVKHEAERVAYQVSGVRFVVNNLNINR